MNNNNIIIIIMYNNININIIINNILIIILILILLLLLLLLIIIIITRRFQVVPKTSENINPRKEGGRNSFYAQRFKRIRKCIACRVLFLLPNALWNRSLFIPVQIESGA
jgi:hypothetical protein